MAKMPFGAVPMMKKNHLNIEGLRSIAKIGITNALRAAALVLVFTGTKVHGGEDRQQVWLISTRCAPLSGDLDSGEKSICYWQLSTDHQWRSADEDAFYADDEAKTPTTIVIHGNRVDADEAIDFAWHIYRRMVKVAQDQPFRLVIWSWPSERMCRGIRPDTQLKLCYCDVQAYYLAACIDRLRQKDVPVCLIGYSMGGKIIPGSLHLLAGGEVGHRTLTNRHSSDQAQKSTPSVRAVLVAAGVDDDSLCADGVYNLALSQVESMLIVKNCYDRVLKWYPRIYGRGGPEALGFVGPICNDHCENIEMLDLSCELGRNHKWEGYLMSCRLIESIDRYTFLKSNPVAAE